MADVEAWVEESIRKGERVVVVLRNLTTKEEATTRINPEFIAAVTREAAIEKGE